MLCSAAALLAGKCDGGASPAGLLASSGGNSATPPRESPAARSAAEPAGVAARISSCYRIVCIVIRMLRLTVICLPLVVLAPLAAVVQSFESVWNIVMLRTIESCGPVFIKLGQWASTRRDLFPEALCSQLSQLQRNAPQHAWRCSQRALAEAFAPVPVAELFAHVDPEPIGSGCCAQVHMATLNRRPSPTGGGDDDETAARLSKDLSGPPNPDFSYRYEIPPPPLLVAIKILHPNIEAEIARDLGVIRLAVGAVTFLFPSLNWLSIREGVEEFADLMDRQTNLLLEAESLRTFRRNFADSADVSFPEPVMELCHRNVLVETFECGRPLASYIDKGSTAYNADDKFKKAVANIGVEMILKMIFEDNFVHGDLHPGNLLVHTPPTEHWISVDSDKVSTRQDVRPQLVVLDTGIVSSLSAVDRQNLIAVFTAIVTNDFSEVGRLFLERSDHRCQDPEAFIADMGSLVASLRADQLSLARVDVSELLRQLFDTLLRHKVKLDASFSSVILAIMVLEGLGRSLDPDIDLVSKAKPYLLKTR